MEAAEGEETSMDFPCATHCMLWYQPANQPATMTHSGKTVDADNQPLLHAWNCARGQNSWPGKPVALGENMLACFPRWSCCPSDS